MFEPSRRRNEPLGIKLPSIKALTASRSASTVAAYLSRQAEQQQLLPAQRHALRRLNSQYFALRRSVFSDQRLSYFVTLKTDAGERTLWGVALAEAMEHAGVKPGEQLRLEDLGTQPVVVQEVAADGTVTEKTTHRREWAAEPTAPERQEAEPQAPITATSAPMTTDDDEPGMSQD
ncbi:hypothetical protein [Pseudomonas sp. W5-01]|uniref:hypothetical protein n=1 Tax=Pseudomonas sp. W5-01 TaxID=3097454 RepID=UPI00397C14EC